MAKQQQQTQRGAKPGAGKGNQPQSSQADAALAKRLKMMNQKWQSSREESTKPGFGEGTTLTSSTSGVRHICRLSAARLVMVKDSPAVVFEFTAVQGDEIGEKAVRFCNFGKDEQIVYLQRDLRKLGVPVDDFNAEELPAQLEQLVAEAPACRITVKQNGEYVNVYIDKMVSLDDDNTGGDAGGDTPGDDAGDAGDGTDDAGDGSDAGDAGDDAGDGSDAGDAGDAGDGSDGGDAGDGDDELPPEAGDKVAVVHKGKKVRGEVKSFNASKNIAQVAIKGEPKTVPFKKEQLTILAA
jgi:hypothetical protein